MMIPTEYSTQFLAQNHRYYFNFKRYDYQNQKIIVWAN